MNMNDVDVLVCIISHMADGFPCQAGVHRVLACKKIMAKNLWNGGRF